MQAKCLGARHCHLQIVSKLHNLQMHQPILYNKVPQKKKKKKKKKSMASAKYNCTFYFIQGLNLITWQIVNFIPLLFFFSHKNCCSFLFSP